MDSRISRHCAALIGLTALVVGCERDTSERQGSARDGAALTRPGDSALARNDSGQPPAAANRDSTVRPPTTATNPAAPGSAAAPTAPRLMARAEIQPLGDHTARGVVEFEQAPPGSSGPMTIHVMLMGLDAGPHGMHVHMGTDCMAPGTHLNPLDAPHGPANAASGMRHLGDLGNITADASGMVEEMPDVITRGFVLDARTEALLKEIPGLVGAAIDGASVEERTDPGLIKERIRVDLQRFFRKRSGLRPFVLPVVMEI